jgi:hypothetical protein
VRGDARGRRVEVVSRFRPRQLLLIREFTTPMGAYQRANIAGLQEAFLLFRRLGVDVPSLSAREFTAAYYDLAKRYHPDIGNRNTQQLMANINAARTTILRAYRKV